MKNDKIHIYFVPGMATDEKIFKYLALPKEHFELHFLDWLMPLTETESLSDYAQRMAEGITHKNPVLIGVSLGGMVVQEISKIIATKQLIIISSIKSSKELPSYFRLFRKTGIYKLFPSKFISNLENYSFSIFGKKIKKRVALYKEFLAVKDVKYLNWCVYCVLYWNQPDEIKGIFHIHGDNDHIFPIKYINQENCICIKNGTHIMIVTKAKKLSNILSSILLN